MTFDVYISLDDQNRIVGVNSSEYLIDTTGWRKVDEGVGDRYHHAQGGYLPDTLTTEQGTRRWMSAPVTDHPGREPFTTYDWRGKTWGIYLRTDAELAEEGVIDSPSTGEVSGEWAAKVDDRLESYEQQLEMLLEGAVSDG